MRRSPPPLRGTPPSEVTSPPSPSSASVASLRSISAARCLNRTSRPRRPANAAASRAPALSIELLGTINEPGHSYAIVSYPGSPWELRGVGERFDTPAGSVTIVEITPRRVTLRHRGEQRRLEMPEPEVPRP